MVNRQIAQDNTARSLRSLPACGELRELFWLEAALSLSGTVLRPLGFVDMCGLQIADRLEYGCERIFVN